jgi:hypothetical protein
MAVKRMDHVGIVVSDLAAATAFFVELRLEPQGEGQVEGAWVDRIVGLEGVRSSLAFLQTELVGTVERYEDAYRLCYIRGPEGIIVELAERLG